MGNAWDFWSVVTIVSPLMKLSIVKFQLIDYYVKIYISSVIRSTSCFCEQI